MVMMHIRKVTFDLNRSTLHVSTAFDMTTTAASITMERTNINDDNNSKGTIVIPVFYNLFVDPKATAEEIARVEKLVSEQLSLRQPWHKISINSIGNPSVAQSIVNKLPNTTILNHYDSGSEMITLGTIYDYCHDYPTSDVVYLHSKGSYHGHPKNELLRQFLTRGALSTFCSFVGRSQNDNDASTTARCNVCSSRFSPFPHPHTSGNMWKANCGYIRKLIPPEEFAAKMADVEQITQSVNPAWCIGSRRYAAEHWIYSNPSVKPCDLYTCKEFQWGYDNLHPSSGLRNGDFQLSMAPRYNISESHLGCMMTFGKQLQHRLGEYKFLYDQLPDESWWGWTLWSKEFDVLYNNTIPSIDHPNIRITAME